MSNAQRESAGPVVEKFASSAGRWLGVAAAVAGMIMVLGAVLDGLAKSRGVALWGVALAGVSWVVMIRPAVVAHANGLVLRNMLRDSLVPWSCIERCRTLQTLQVATPYGVFHGLGISRSARAVLKQRRGAPQRGFLPGFGGVSMPEPAKTQGHANQEQIGGSYLDYVESRIVSLADGDSEPDFEPVVTWAPGPIAALALAVVAIALSFV